MNYQSRWGFHPCSYEAYLKLKQLHKHYWITVRHIAEWNRWNRKESQNRVIRKWKRNEKGQKIGFVVVGPKPEPSYDPAFSTKCKWTGEVHPKDYGIIEAYRNARTPKRKESVVPLNVSEKEIEQLLLKIYI